jgi:hypothetical protein
MGCCGGLPCARRGRAPRDLHSQGGGGVLQAAMAGRRASGGAGATGGGARSIFEVG